MKADSKERYGSISRLFHWGMALFHHFVKKDGTLKRML